MEWKQSHVIRTIYLFLYVHNGKMWGLKKNWLACYSKRKPEFITNSSATPDAVLQCFSVMVGEYLCSTTGDQNRCGDWSWAHLDSLVAGVHIMLQLQITPFSQLSKEVYLENARLFISNAHRHRTWVRHKRAIVFSGWPMSSSTGAVAELMLSLRAPPSYLTLEHWYPFLVLVLSNDFLVSIGL